MLIAETTWNTFDLETTGLSPATDRIVEMASVMAKVGHGVFGSWSTLVNPGIPIPATASAIHHLVDEDVADAHPLEVVLPRLVEGEFQAVAAHNAPFDLGFVSFPDKPALCTRRLAQKLWPELEHTSNQFLRYHFKLACPEVKGLAAHRAEADALVTAHLLLFELEEVLRRAKDPSGATVEGLIAWVNAPLLLRTCRFGKHRGTAWSEVPKDYLQWMLSPKGMTDMDTDLRFTVEYHLNA